MLRVFPTYYRSYRAIIARIVKVDRFVGGIRAVQAIGAVRVVEAMRVV